MDLYDETLENLANWLANYTRVSFTSNESKKPVKAFLRVVKSRPKDSDPATDKMRYMERVANSLTEVFEGEDIGGLYSPHVTLDHKELLDLFVVMESARFNKLMDGGYRKLYKLYDEAKVLAKFKTSTSVAYHPVSNFHKAMHLVAEAIDGLPNAGDDLLNLYINIREMETDKPTFLVALMPYLSDMYGDRRIGSERAEKYLQRVSILGAELKVIRSVYKLEYTIPDTPDPFVSSVELRKVLDAYIDALASVYVAVVYEKILRVV